MKSSKDNPKEITPALARIHAHICADGSLYKCREKDNYGYYGKHRKNPYRVRYTVIYTNNNRNLIKEFRKDIKEIFAVRGKSRRSKDNKNINEIRINSRRIWDFLKQLGVGGSHNWYIPKEIIKGSKKIKINWIRAFFDDEAYFDKNNRIRVKIVNEKGLKQLRNILKEFVPCNITPKTGSYWGKTYCLNVLKSNVDKYNKITGSNR